MKTIVSLDGGGIRGVLSLQILAKIEQIYREKHNNPELVLSDVIDFFAGTSTGALIATALSWGMSVAEIERLYFADGSMLFKRETLISRWKSKYSAISIGNYLQALFQDNLEGINQPALLGTDKLKTLLMVVIRNASTGSAWPVTNNPNAIYNQRELADCNLDIPLWQLLRASTAAPSFFPPQAITIGDRTDLFVDGGTTPYNNPALMAFLTATLPSYNLNWETGTDKIKVISIGTGQLRTKFPPKKSHKIHMLDQIGHMIPALIGSAADNQDMLSRVIGQCIYGDEIDSEIGDLMNPSKQNQEKQFSYLRYDLKLDEEISNAVVKKRWALDNLALMPELKQIGEAYAKAHVSAEHL